MDTRTTVGRWESDGGKYWVELYRDRWGYGYDAKGSGGFIGKHENVSESDAVDYITARTAGGVGYFHSGKRPMLRTV
jgi:hypothetical protein